MHKKEERNITQIINFASTLVLLSRAESGNVPCPLAGLMASSAGLHPKPCLHKPPPGHVCMLARSPVPEGTWNPPDPAGEAGRLGWVGPSSLLTGLVGSPRTGAGSSGPCWALQQELGRPPPHLSCWRHFLGPQPWDRLGQGHSCRKLQSPVAWPRWDGHWGEPGATPRSGGAGS